METLTYWVQRLEPVIRAEGEHEIIVVFCNRTGFEDDAVYAGTSTVLGISDGEVNVYGILGRGVKELLVVDTDDAPFAKLVQRADGDTETASTASRSRKSDNSSGRNQLSPKTTTASASTVYSGQRRLTPDPGASTNPNKQKPMAPRIQIPERGHDSRHSATHDTPIEESPWVATPTCPSPTPFSDRPLVNVPESRPTKEHANTPFARDNATEQDIRTWARQFSIDQPTRSTDSPSSEYPTEKYFWLPTQSALKSPMETRFPQHYPSPSPAAVIPVPSSLIRVPPKERLGAKSPLAPKSPRSVKSSGSSHSGRPGRQQQKLSTSKDNTSQPDDDGPPRPSSPKSRNASRTGRPLGRRGPEFEQPDLSDMIGKLEESIVRRPGSAMDSRPSDSEQPRQGRPRSPKSRNASRTGRHVQTPQLEGRVGDISRTDYPFTARPSVFADFAARPQTEILTQGEASASRGTFDTGVIRPCPRAGAQSRNRSLSGAALGHPYSRPGSTSCENAESVPHIEPDETRTLIWSELSKIVGEVLDRPQSRGASRGRQPAASRATAAGGLGSNRTTRSESRGPPTVSRMDQRFASQDRQGVARPAKIRTILAPNGTNGSSMAYNSDDEIVAEIIFRSQGCPTHSQINTQVQSTSSQTGNPKSPPSSLPRGNLPQDKSSNSRLSQRRNNAPQGHNLQRQGSWPPKSTNDRRPPPMDSFGVHVAPLALNARSHTKSSDSCPTMDGSSVHTLTTPKGSPATPHSRFFEPKTPKAMKLDPDLSTILTSSSDPNSGGDFPHMGALENDLPSIGLVRPRSAVW
jgi:hypothetical protein